MGALILAVRGRVHQARGNLAEAISSFQSALSALPGDTPAWARRRAEYLAEIADSYEAGRRCRLVGVEAGEYGQSMPASTSLSVR